MSTLAADDGESWIEKAAREAANRETARKYEWQQYATRWTAQLSVADRVWLNSIQVQP